MPFFFCLAMWQIGLYLVSPMPVACEALSLANELENWIQLVSSRSPIAGPRETRCAPCGFCWGFGWVSTELVESRHLGAEVNTDITMQAGVGMGIFRLVKSP